MADLKNDSEVLNDIRKIIEQGRHQAYAAAGQQLQPLIGVLAGEQQKRNSMVMNVLNMVHI